MLSPLCLPLFYLLACLPLLHAYAIDDNSCKFNEYALMHAAIDEAFTRADVALDAIHNGVRDEDVRRLILLLFGINGREDFELNHLRETFPAILLARDKLDPQDPRMINRNQIKYFCNLDRVQLRLNNLPGQPARWTDVNTGFYFNDEPGEDTTSCKSSSDRTLAFTVNPGQRSWIDPGGNIQSEDTPSQITMCPWFVEWAVHAKYQESNPKTIDMPKTLVNPVGLAYGWKAATELARQRGADIVPTTETPVAFTNADSIALFASGVRLLYPGSPVYIERDGILSKTRPEEPYGKQWERRSSSPSPAFGGFITMVKEAHASATDNAWVVGTKLDQE